MGFYGSKDPANSVKALNEDINSLDPPHHKRIKCFFCNIFYKTWVILMKLGT